MFLLKGCLHLRIGVSITIGTCGSDRINKQISSLSDILIKLNLMPLAVETGSE